MLASRKARRSVSAKAMHSCYGSRWFGEELDAVGFQSPQDRLSSHLSLCAVLLLEASTASAALVPLGVIKTTLSQNIRSVSSAI
jgi:hypothetical protein